MSIHHQLAEITHNMRLSVAKQRRGWFNAVSREARFNIILAVLCLIAAAVLLYLMGDLEGRPLRMAIGFVAGLLAFVLVARAPDSLIGVVLILNATIFGFGAFSSMMLKFNVFETQEVVLGALLVFAFWEHLRQGKQERASVDTVFVSLLIFYAIVLFQILRAQFLQGREWVYIWDQYGKMCHYLLLLPMIIYLRDPERLRVFLWVLFIGTGVAACQTYYFFFFGAGGWGHLFGLVDVSARGVGLAVRLPSSMLMMGMTIVCFALYLHVDDEKKRKFYLFAMLAFMIAVGMNKGRNAYVGVLIGTATLWVFSSRQARWRAFKDAFWLSAIFFAAAVAIPPLGAKVMNVAEQIGIRFMQTFDPVEYEAGGYRDRMREVEQALPRFYEHPILGQGPGEYLRRTYEVTRLGAHKIVYQPYVHNSYVYILATGGVLTSGAILGMFGVWIVTNLRRVRRLRNPYARAFAWGGVAYMLAMLASSWVQPNFFLNAPITTTVVIVGLAEAAARRDLEEQSRLKTETFKAA
ncbi:MAG: O-antigen ligase family protein [Fimbriimonadia bacterium]|jgi:hypothetical protein